ncbi:tetraspanin-19-like [Phyllopteryx taeniolatus]|uniref:tetraspanin-19-like n=1 Tax=Phyllopteryx taeniolatus TaxID=161469 RepID=UPI002AD26408|nr:tetraspanin-19-like [Phyllopteryx taeniolatus]
MKLEVKVDVVKLFLLFLSFVLLALGLGVACCGVWICFDSGSLIGAVSSDELQAVGAGLLLIGSLVMACSLVACLGACWENRILMLICACGVLFLFLCCVSLLLLLLISKGQIQEHADAAVGRMIRRYHGNGTKDRLLDNLQRHGACCGLTDSSDWLQNSFVQMLNTSATRVLPCSCFRSHRPNLESTPWCSPDLNVTHAVAHANRTHTQGCGEQLSDWLHENIVTVVGMDVCLMAAQVLQLALAVELWRILRTTNKMTDADHAQVGHTATRSDDADSAHWVPSRPVDF